MQHNIILGIGSSCGNRIQHLRTAITHLKNTQGIFVEKVAPVYISDAHLPENADPSWHTYYLNSALCCSSILTPQEFLATIKSIEKRIGRKPAARWAPRIIDIDILSFGAEKIQQDNLTVPHQEILNRPFALWPLLDLQPSWQHERFSEQLEQWGDRVSGNAPFRTRRLNQQLVGPELIGIVNITPDSFSADGLNTDYTRAIEQAKQQFTDGATILDIGAESTNPNSIAMTSEQECQRLLPFLDALCQVWTEDEFKPRISVDTYHAETVKKILNYPIDMVNDVSTRELFDIVPMLTDTDKQYVFMHSLDVPVVRGKTLPEHCDPVQEILVWGQQTLNKLLRMGMQQQQLIFDPGIGFGNSPAQALELLQRVNEFSTLGVPIYVGHSRKSFMNQFTDKSFSDRDLETTLVTNYLAIKNISYLRVHNVAANNQAIKIAHALQPSKSTQSTIMKQHETVAI